MGIGIRLLQRLPLHVLPKSFDDIGRADSAEKGLVVAWRLNKTELFIVDE